MSTAEQVATFADCYNQLINRVRADTSDTVTVDHAKEMINTALFDMHNGFRESLPWAERYAVLITQQTYTTGTVSISQGSTTLTGSSTAWDTANAFSIKNARAGGKIKIGASEVYEVSSVDSDTQITLTTKYVGSDASGDSYTYYEDEYDLASDFLRPYDWQFFDQNRNIKIIDRRLFRQLHIRNNVPGKMTQATVVDRAFSGNTTPRRRVILHRPPDTFYQIPYNYITSNHAVTSAGVEQAQLVNDTDEPIVPLHARHLIVLHGLYNWYRDKKNDTERSKSAHDDYTSALVRVVGDVEIGASRPQFQPRAGLYVGPARRPYRSRTSKYTTGTRFDELRD